MYYNINYYIIKLPGKTGCCPFSFRYDLTAMLAFSRNLCIYSLLKLSKANLTTTGNTIGSDVAIICYSAVNK